VTCTIATILIVFSEEGSRYKEVVGTVLVVVGMAVFVVPTAVDCMVHPFHQDKNIGAITNFV
jgi:hypothetical protein